VKPPQNSTLIYQNTKNVWNGGIMSIIDFTQKANELLSDRAVLWPIPDTTKQSASPVILLEGPWKVNSAPSENFYEPDTRLDDWTDIMVPFDENVPKTSGAYVLDTKIPADWNGQQILLRLEGTSNCADVYCNGHFVRSHFGCAVPWDCDITPFCVPGEITRIAIGLKTESTVWLGASGLYRNVNLYTQPHTHLTRFHADTFFDDTYTDSRLVIHTGMVSSSENTATLRIYLDETLLGESELENGKDTDVEFLIKAPKKWDSEHPHLYTLTAKLYHDGEELETTHKRIGFREVKRVEDQVFVNGQEIKLHGVNRHDTHPLSGRGLTREMIEYDVKMFKEGNVNFIRTSHYPPSEYFLALCDEYGIYVEDEAALAFVGFGFSYTMHDPEYAEKYLQPVKEQIEYHRSHPCVIIWSLANESYYGDNFRLVTKYVQQADPTRLTIFDYQITMQEDDDRHDIWSIHYVDWNQDLAALMDQDVFGYVWPVPHKYPVLHDESTHIPTFSRRDMQRDPGVHNFWGETIRRFWDRAWTRKGVLGCSVWSGFDEVSFHHNQYSGWPFGMVDSWRRKKSEWWDMRKAFSYVKIFPETFTSGETTVLKVENRFNHTNLNETTIQWKSAEKSGSFRGPDAQPHEIAALIFPVRLTSGETLEIAILDSQGYQVNEAKLVYNQNLLSVPSADAGAPGISEDDNYLTLTGENCELILSKETGLIVKGSVNGQTVVSGGPCLHLEWFPLAPWKLQNMHCEALSNCAIVHLRGTYGKIAVSFRIAFDKAGTMVTDYTIDHMPYSSPRNQHFHFGHDCGGYEEVGLSFDIPKKLDILSWKRRDQWSVMPQWHANRLEGEAKRFANPDKPIDLMTKPDHAWKDDGYDPFNFGKYDIYGKGSIDFRSMKSYIYDASMNDGNGHAFRVLSDGTDSVRADGRYSENCIYNDDDTSITYSGKWFRVDTRNRTRGSEHIMSNEPGAKAEFKFHGTGCVWYATKDFSCGMAKVYLDGEFKDEVDLSRKRDMAVSRGYEASYNEIMYSVRDLEDGEHTLTIEVCGTQGTSGAGSYVTLDYMLVMREDWLGDVRFYIDNEFNYPDLTYGCWRKDPILVDSGYTNRVVTRLG